MTVDRQVIESLLVEARARPTSALSARERRYELAIGLAFAAVVAAMIAWLPEGGTRFDVPVALGLVAAHVAAQRVEFEIGAGMTNATQLVLVPMLLLLPVTFVPVAVALALVVARVPACLTGRRHPERILLAVPDAWHAVGPALLIAAAGAPAPRLSLIGLYTAALAAQFVVDTGTGVARDYFALGVAPKLQLRLLGWVMLADAALAPIGLLAGLQAVGRPVVAVLLLPLIGLLASFARERRHGLDQAIELSNAYRGTALLMGDMLEADDAYTGGEHSQGVVALSLAVGEELGLDGTPLRNLEFGALLHDVGKILVPNEIINKPGKLTDEEFEIVKRHPVDGQRMLDRIGGALRDVGLIVRSHHERWDGRGYPDGLAGDEIPLGARIICACDAFSAMTTDRSYRRAMSVEVALDELRRCAGSQFDVQVVDALDAVLARRASRGEPAKPQLAALVLAEVA
jgi:HD-GYP domain-containing protein (c-di-GMP phosphodiesterase class II)